MRHKPHQLVVVISAVTFLSSYGKRFVVRADEMLTAFVELQKAIHQFAVSLVL